MAGSLAYATDATDLGTLPGGWPMCYVNGVSGDGLFAVGGASDAVMNMKAYYWTFSTGMVDLGTLGGAEGEAIGINSDGSVIVGWSLNGGGQEEAFRWTQAGGMVGLGTLGGVESYAIGTNSDGSVVVGKSLNGAGQDEAFRWTQAGGMVGLGTLGGLTSDAYDVSSDGTVVIGAAKTAAGNDNAYRWTQASGMVSLGTLGGIDSFGNGVSNDGSVLVGYSMNINGDDEAFRWTQETGMVGLGTLGGANSLANDVSGDGSVVVGVSQNSDGDDEAFVWTDMGMASLNDMLANAGVDMSRIYLFEATAISDDGSTIVADGANAVTVFASYIIRDGGIVTASGLSDSLGEMSRVSSDLAYMAAGTMRAVMDQASHLPEPGTTKMWVVGSLLGDPVNSDDFGGEGGFGMTAYLADGLTVGGGMFLGRRDTDTKWGGNQLSTAFGPGMFVNYAPEEYGLRAKLGIFGERVSLDINRGYANGGGSTVASGTTDAHLFGMSGHLGWIRPVTERIAVQPFLEYDLQAVSVDEYTERNTPFPAHFNARKDVSNKTRLGCELRYDYRENIDLWSWAAWSHRFERKGPSMDGYLVGLSSFNFSGAKVDQDWGEVGGGMKWKGDDGIEAFSRLTVAVGNDHYVAPDVALNTGLAWTF